ncbi:MAG: malto-oligosyltrehalose trehalohydrolase [Rhodopirellula sp.]|nr:malto-oligosyltrehalose trehalohydrolase [Rhodopirellula sp.]
MTINLASTHNRPDLPDRKPQGVSRQSDGSVLWRIWAPQSDGVSLVVIANGKRQEIPMEPEGYGFFTHRRDGVAAGLRYAYKLKDGGEYPDPVSRWQPEGLHRPSAVFFPDEYAWSDDDWKGVAREDLVIYELHVGTFTPEGTFDAIVPRLAQLRELGVTAIEIMPVAQFAGGRNWGYDGVHPNAVQNTYGGPQGLQRLVDAAHRAGVAVLMDVVYNHIGPEGNYLGKFGHYFTDRYHTPWGDAINFDDADCGPVRQLVVDNAVMWIRDFHIDGLRLDAVDAIFDFSAHHILAELQAAVQAEAARGGRTVHVIAESDLNDMRLIDPVERGGYALDGCWADDFHHAVHTLLTGEREGYYSDFGEPAHLAKAYNDVFIYDGVYSRFRRRRHGNAVGDADRSQFVVCIHNHDQIGNRAQGDRMAATLPPEARRLAAGLLLLSPCLPLLFMGEEYGEERPFPFFCSFGDPGLIEAVRKGRRAEFAALAFEWGTEIPDPQDPATFESARLSWSWPEGSSRASLRRLYQDLLTARRTWPPLGERQRTEASVVPVEGGASAVLVIRRGGEGGLLAVANLTAEIQPLPAIDLGPRALLLSSESKWYGGSREGERRIGRLHPYELVLFGEDGWRS